MKDFFKINENILILLFYIFNDITIDYLYIVINGIFLKNRSKL